jgi:hypothetical protein
MPRKTSVPSNSRSKRKPTRAHSWPDADGVQNETAERDEAFRRAILATPAGKVSTATWPRRPDIRGVTDLSPGFGDYACGCQICCAAIDENELFSLDCFLPAVSCRVLLK